MRPKRSISKLAVAKLKNKVFSNWASLNQIDFSESFNELTVGKPKILGRFLRPQNNSRDVISRSINLILENKTTSGHLQVFIACLNDLKLNNPHDMGDCILTFESINKDNPLATNAKISLLHEKWLRVESSSTNSYIARARHCPSKTYFEWPMS